jgi:hypothetical protein
VALVPSLIGLVPSKIPFTFSICQGNAQLKWPWKWVHYNFIIFFFIEVRGMCRKQFCLFWLPELWIFRHPARRYRVVPSPGFEPMTLSLWLRVRRPNHSATTLHNFLMSSAVTRLNLLKFAQWWLGVFSPAGGLLRSSFSYLGQNQKNDQQGLFCLFCAISQKFCDLLIPSSMWWVTHVCQS